MIFIGIPRLLSYFVPKINDILKEYRNTKSNKICLTLSLISSSVLIIVFIFLTKFQSDSYLEVHHLGAVFIPILALGFLILRYTEYE